MTVTVTGTGVPQTSQGRTRSEMAAELVSYIGGTNLPAALNRAKKSLDTAVRRFNNVLWAFNVVEQDITLVASTDEYSLALPFRGALRAYILDSNSKRRGLVSYFAYPEWLVWSSQDATGAGTVPNRYTIRNIHRESKVIYNPMGATLKYPTVHHVYYTRIMFNPGSGDRLNVPDDVDEAIFRWALYDLILKERGPSEAVLYAQDATAIRAAVEVSWRAWGEIPVIGVE